MSSTLKCNNCNLVVDEMLSYIQNKLSLIDEESLIKICLSTFTSVQIEKSKSLLFESLPSDQRKPARKGQGKDNRVLNDIISVFKVTEPDVMPVFVARDLEKLPPITFDHLDVSKLLKDLTVVQAEIKDIKASYVTTDQLEELKKDIKSMSVSVSSRNINRKRGACRDDESILLSQKSISMVECSNSPNNPSLALNKNESEIINKVEGMRCKIKTAENILPLSTLNSSPRPANANESHQITDNGTLDAQLGDSMQIQYKQSFADVTKLNRHIENVDDNNDWIIVRNRKLRMKERFMGKIGNSIIDAGEKFKPADRKVPIFITNVHKDTADVDIENYICRKSAINVKLEKINLRRQTDYNAYKFFVSQSDVHMFLNSEMWPKGIIFRRFVHFRPRITKVTTNSGEDGQITCNING